MTRTEQRQFVDNLMTSINRSLLEKIDKLPEDWDGREIRQWISDTVREQAGTLDRKTKRFRDYQNAVAVNNL